jgi:hypothetical protein
VPWLTQRLREWSAARGAGPSSGAVAWLRRVAQGMAEARYRDVRMQTLRHDRQLSRLLAFTGRGE